MILFNKDGTNTYYPRIVCSRCGSTDTAIAWRLEKTGWIKVLHCHKCHVIFTASRDDDESDL